MILDYGLHLDFRLKIINFVILVFLNSQDKPESLAKTIARQKMDQYFLDLHLHQHSDEVDQE